MPEVAVKTRDQIAADQIQFILRQDWFQPETLKKYIGALKNWQPNQLSLIIDGQIISYNRIVADLQQFLRSLPPDRRQNLAADGLAPDQLDLLDSIIDEVAGSAATAEAASPPPANIPLDLKALVAEFDKAHQAAVSAQAKRQGWSPERFREELAKQNAITFQMHQVRQYTLSQLEWAINNSTALENLAASLGRRPEVVKRLALMRAKALVDKEITAQTFRQTLLYNKIKDPVLLASLYTNQLKADLLKDDLLILAAVDKDPKTKQKYLDTALKKTKETVAQETEKAKPAIEAAAKNLEEHPTNRKAAQADAIAAIKQVETVSLNRQPSQQLKPAKAIRLAEELARHPDNPDRQERIIRSVLGATSSQAKVIRGQLTPQINQLAASSVKPNYLAMADPDSIFNDISLHPNRFPRPLVDAVRSGRINDPGKLANAIIISRNLNIPLEAVVLSEYGVYAQKLADRWQQSPKFLWIIPMGHSVDSKDPDVIKLTAKLAGLEPAQKQLTDSLKTPPPLLLPQIPRQFLKTVARNSRAVRLSNFIQNINIFHLPSAVSFNLGRLPPFKPIFDYGSVIVSHLRVNSAPVNSIFNFFSSVQLGIKSLPSAIMRPLMAPVDWAKEKIIAPVGSWAKTQVRTGLARAGAWLAKKGLTKAAKDIGMGLVGKGTAALLAQAVPVAGQIVGIAALLLSFGDIGKFIWEHKNEIGIGLGGLYLFGLKALSALINLLGSAAWTLGGAALGFAVGGPIGAAIGGTLGYLIGSGALGSVLSGIGTALGSAAASLSSFIGTLTAPSLVASLPATLALIVPATIGGAIIYQTILSPDSKIFPALFVAPDSGTFPPGGGYIPPEILGSCPIPGGTLLCGSFTNPNSPYCQHGDNSYWGGGRTPCDWPIPLSDPANCTYNNATGSVCDSGNNSCPWYGFAADFRYTPAQCDLPVYLPSLNGQSLNWEVVDNGTWASGKWGMLRAADGTNSYEMLFGHLIEQPVGGSSGTEAGMLFCGPNHLHVELKINGEYVRPDSLCQGAGFIVASPTPTPPPGPGHGRR